MPTKPEKALKRILTISRLDGRSVIFIAGLSTLLSLCFLDWFGVIIGGLVTFAGAYELRGHKRLLSGNADGMSHLVRAQLLILATIWVYSITSLVTFNEAKSVAHLNSALGSYGMDSSDSGPYLKQLNRLTYSTVLGVTLLFQGGLAIFYQSRRVIIAQALAERTAAAKVPPAVPPSLPGE